jgi:hypothetical protein
MSASSLQNATALLVIDILQLLLMNNNLSMVVIGGLVQGVIFHNVLFFPVTHFLPFILVRSFDLHDVLFVNLF